MRKQLKLRFTQPKDTEEVAKWLTGTKGNLFDAAILQYPTLQMLTSYEGETNIAHLPMQRALFLESLAVNPEVPVMDAGQAFRDLVKGSQVIASAHGIREIYFICEDENVLRVAENHGFERIEFPVVRMKLR